MDIKQKGLYYFKKEHVCLDFRHSRMFHFKVLQDSGEIADVWYTYNKYYRTWEWSCGAVGVNSQGRKWTCALNIKADKTKPFCSHTYAAKLYKDKILQM